MRDCILSKIEGSEILLLLFFFFLLFRATLVAYGSFQAGVKSELQLLAWAIGIAMWNLSCVFCNYTTAHGNTGSLTQ